jgi:tetratricopeptide (TPR) repeat protein
MTTKRILIAIAVIGALIAGALVYASTRPLILAAKLQPDLDPATATPAEWRAQAKRVLDEIETVARILPEDSPQQVRQRNTSLHLASLLSVRLGDVKRTLSLLGEISDTTEQSRVLRAVCFEPAALGQPGVVTELLEAAPTDEDAARVLSALAMAYARSGEPARAEQALADPRFESESPDQRHPNRRLLPLGEIAKAYAREGDYEEAARIAERAEAVWVSGVDPRSRHDGRMNIAEMYIAAHDLDSALRIIDDATDDFRVEELLSDIAKVQAVQQDLEAAAQTRGRIENLFLRAYACTYPAADHAQSGRTEIARGLFAEADRISEGLTNTIDRFFMLVHMTEYRHKGGLHDDANATADRALNLLAEYPASPAKATELCRLLEVQIEADQAESSRALLELIIDVFETSDPSLHHEYSLENRLASAAAALGLEEDAELRFAAATAAAMSEEDLPARIERLRRIAMTQAEHGRVEGASQTFALAIAALSELEPAEAARSAKQLSRALAEAGRVTAAIDITGTVADPFERVTALEAAGSILAFKAERIERGAAN